jgi:16S rRNA U516 pseudouridylate synthase RsuA-like enzyme
VGQRIREIKRVRSGCLKFYGLDNRFQSTRELQPEERADVFKAQYLTFAYEFDYNQAI